MLSRKNPTLLISGAMGFTSPKQNPRSSCGDDDEGRNETRKIMECEGFSYLLESSIYR